MEGKKRKSGKGEGARSWDVDADKCDHPFFLLNVLCLDGFIPAGKYIIGTRPEPSPIEQYRALLRQTGTPESKECIAFRRAHHSDKTFMATVMARRPWKVPSTRGRSCVRAQKAERIAMKQNAGKPKPTKQTAAPGSPRDRRPT